MTITWRPGEGSVICPSSHSQTEADGILTCVSLSELELSSLSSFLSEEEEKGKEEDGES